MSGKAADPLFEQLLARFLEGAGQGWFEINKRWKELLEYSVAKGTMKREIVEGEIVYRDLEAEKRVVLEKDYIIARAGRQLKEQYGNQKIAARMMAQRAAPAGIVVEVKNFRRRALQRKLRGVTEDNEKGLVLCEWLMSARLSARELEFVESLKEQILTKGKTFELSDRQADWLRDIWRRERRKSDEHDEARPAR
jgi:hypothetical protein